MRVTNEYVIKEIENEIIKFLKEAKNDFKNDKKVIIEHIGGNDLIVNYIATTKESLSWRGIDKEREVIFITSNAIFPLHVNLMDYDYVDTEYIDNVLFVKVAYECEIRKDNDYE